MPKLYGNTFAPTSTIAVKGRVTANTLWRVDGNVARYRLYDGVFDRFRVNAGFTLTVGAGVKVNATGTSDYSEILGTMTTTGVTFTGSTRLLVKSAGRLDLTNCNVAGDRVEYPSGSIGQVENTRFSLGFHIHSDASVAFTSNSFEHAHVYATGTTTAEIDMTENWWGTTDPAVIETKIDHRPDNTPATRPLVFYEPFLVSWPPVVRLPIASLTVTNVTTGGGSTHDFTVTYTANVAIDVSSLDSNDILVTGPNGYSQNGTPRTATYRINAPGGSWDQADNGTYTVQMRNAAVRDTSNNYAAAGTLATFSVNLAPPNAAAYRVFHLLALIYPEVQIPQNGSAPATSASMDQATLEAIIAGVQLELPTMINQLAGDQIQARVHVEVVDRPLDQPHWDGAHYQWATESMIAPELDAFTKSGWYDHVFVFHGLVNELGPTAWWGGGGLARYGMSMASLNFSRSDGKLGDHDVPGMIHEWMHGLEVQYFEVRGVPRGNDPDSQSLELHDAGKFGYTDITENRPGWSAWYRDFLTDRIRNLHSDGSDTGLGLGPDAWILGMPRHDVPYTSGGPLERPDVTNTRPVFLSDIYWASAETGHGEIRRDATACNHPIRIHGVEYDKGVGIHANGKILVNLRGRAERFQADTTLASEQTA